MKILNRVEFLQKPEGTLFSKYVPCLFGELSIKGENVGDNDFYYQSINDAIKCNSSDEFSEILFKAQETGESIQLDFYCVSRDGIFDDDLFAVWEIEDVLLLIKRLKICLDSYLYRR